MRFIFQVCLFIFIAGALAACGFTPQYAARAHGAPAQALLRSVQIDQIPDESGVMLRNKLMDQFYAGGRLDPAYTLVVLPLHETRQNLDITIDEEATRRELRVMADVTLKKKEDGSVVFHRTFYAISSFNVLKSQFTTHVGEQNARENSVTDLARQIEQACVLALTL